MYSPLKRWRLLAALMAAVLTLLCLSSTALAYNTDTPAELAKSDLTAASAILIDGHTGRVLFSKDADTQRYPASTTKIMTLLLALENVDDLDSTVTIPREANQYPEGSSLVGLYTGEEMTWRTLLTTFFICSGNDAGIAIAILVAGDEAGFVNMMNAKAAELGCENTHFANPHGFHDPDHYTTARDLSTIALYAMKNETFRTIASSTNYTIPANNKRSEPTTKWTHNQFIARNDTSMNYKYPYGTGIKTGYTSKAGSTFVGSATKDGVDLISVVLLSTTDGKWIDSIRLMEYGFATYDDYDPVALYSQSPLTVSVSDFDSGDASGGVVSLSISGSENTDPICATTSELSDITANFSTMLSVSYSRELKAPVNAGDVFGTLTYTAPGGEKYNYTLTAANSVAAVPATTLPSIDEAIQGGDTAAEGGQSGSGMLLWLIPLIAVIAVLIAMVVINMLRNGRRTRSYARTADRPVRRVSRDGDGYEDGYRPESAPAPRTPRANPRRDPYDAPAARGTSADGYNRTSAPARSYTDRAPGSGRDYTRRATDSDRDYTERDYSDRRYLRSDSPRTDSSRSGYDEHYTGDYRRTRRTEDDYGESRSTLSRPRGSAPQDNDPDTYRGRR